MKVKMLVAQMCPAAPWTITHQAPLSMEFSRQEHWSGLPFPSSEYFPTQGSNSGLPLQADSSPSEPPGKRSNTIEWEPSNTIEWEPSNTDGCVVERAGESLHMKLSGSAGQGKGGCSSFHDQLGSGEPGLPAWGPGLHPHCCLISSRQRASLSEV